ncbi:MAG TPA: CrcB family protein [Acidimicrobiales bacterium]
MDAATTPPRPRHHVAVMVGIGGAAGGLARHWVNELLAARPGSWSWSTLVVNVVGAAILGLVVGWLVHRPATPWMVRPLLGTGFCGAFTTFSAFMVQTDALARDGRPAMAAASVGIATVLGLAAARAGLAFAGRTAGRP